MRQAGKPETQAPDEPLKALVRALARQAAWESLRQPETSNLPASGASQEGGGDDGE